MAGNTYGTLFRLTTFGESHGTAIGGVIDGCPAGLKLDTDAVQAELDRRRPGQSKLTTQRNEGDRVEWLSGIFEGTTTGHPIGFVIPNSNQRPADYEHLKDTFRPSHADFTHQAKYGIRDYRGGGRASARETACRVVGGAVARQLLAMLHQVEIVAYVSQVGNVRCGSDHTDIKREDVEANLVRCPDPTVASEMENLIKEIKKQGDTIGGVVTCTVRNVSPGWGEPVFDKLHAELGKAMLSINAVKGFEIGSGFSGASMRGSEHNDLFLPGQRTRTNHSGGVQGGISNGETIYFKVAFKPVATIMQDQLSANASGEMGTVKGKGRHDPCVVPRAVPIVEAMAALVLADFALRSKVSQL